MQRRNPTVTIGVPAFNARAHIAGCLESLLAQTHGDFTLLISDNASTDGTEAICRHYAAVDPRVVYHRQPQNIGMYGNMHFLLRSAATPYVKLASADDFWAPEMVADMLDVLESDPTVVLAYPMMTLVDESGAMIERYSGRLHLLEPDPAIRFRRAIAEIGLVSQLMGVIRTDVVQRMRPLRNFQGEDVPFICELSLYGKLFQTDEFQYFRRMHRNSSSFRRSSDEHQRRYVLGADASGLRFRAWRLNIGLLEGIARSPVPTRIKAELMAHVGRRMLWSRRSLATELLHRD